MMLQIQVSTVRIYFNGKDCDEDIIKFVDSHVSCKADSDDLSDLVSLQRHKHSKTCKKKGHPICRFNFPLPPLPRTIRPYSMVNYRSV